jgi:hypothetical protein
VIRHSLPWQIRPARFPHDKAGGHQHAAGGKGRLGDAIEHCAECRHGDVAAGLMDGRERHAQQGRIFHIVKTDDPRILGDAELFALQRAQEHGCGVVIGADEGVPLMACREAAHKFRVAWIAEMHPIPRRFEPVADERFAGAGDPRIHGRRGVRTRHECQAFAAELDEVFRQKVAAGHVVDAHDVEIAAIGEGQHVAIKKHHRNACLAQGLREPLACAVLLPGEFEGREKHAADPAGDELFAEFGGVFQAGVGIGPRSGGAAPEQAVTLHPRQAGEFARNEFENLRGPETRDQERKLAKRRRRLGRGMADVSAGAGPALDEAFGLKILQRAGHGGPRDAESLHELSLAGKTIGGAIFADGNVGEELPGDGAMLGLRGHGQRDSRPLRGRGGRMAGSFGSVGMGQSGGGDADLTALVICHDSFFRKLQCSRCQRGARFPISRQGGSQAPRRSPSKIPQ